MLFWHSRIVFVKGQMVFREAESYFRTAKYRSATTEVYFTHTLQGSGGAIPPGNYPNSMQ